MDLKLFEGMSRKNFKLEKIYTASQYYGPKYILEGSGYYQITGKPTLGKVLKWMRYNCKSLGTVFIHDSSGEVVYKFGFDLYLGRAFLYDTLPTWRKWCRVKKIKFTYLCYAENIHIYL
jgi:hypothetical protein